MRSLNGTHLCQEYYKEAGGFNPAGSGPVRARSRRGVTRGSARHGVSKKELKPPSCFLVTLCFISLSWSRKRDKHNRCDLAVLPGEQPGSSALRRYEGRRPRL